MPFAWAVVSGSLSHISVTSGRSAPVPSIRYASTARRFSAAFGVACGGGGPSASAMRDAIAGGRANS